MRPLSGRAIDGVRVDAIRTLSTEPGGELILVPATRYASGSTLVTDPLCLFQLDGDTAAGVACWSAADVSRGKRRWAPVAATRGSCPTALRECARGAPTIYSLIAGGHCDGLRHTIVRNYVQGPSGRRV